LLLYAVTDTAHVPRTRRAAAGTGMAAGVGGGVGACAAV